jgi:hypothetical protein
MSDLKADFRQQVRDGPYAAHVPASQGGVTTENQTAFVSSW